MEQVFKSLLGCNFQNKPGGQSVDCDQYCIIDARFGTILIGREEWSQRVFPGSRLVMSIIIESLRRKQGSCPRRQCQETDEQSGESPQFVVWSVNPIARFHQALIGGSSKCGLEYASREQPNEPRIRRGRVNESVNSESQYHGVGEGETPEHGRRQAGVDEEEIKERESREIMSFRRVHISTSKRRTDVSRITEVVDDESEDLPPAEDGNNNGAVPHITPQDSGDEDGDQTMDWGPTTKNETPSSSGDWYWTCCGGLGNAGVCPHIGSWLVTLHVSCIGCLHQRCSSCRIISYR